MTRNVWLRLCEQFNDGDVFPAMEGLANELSQRREELGTAGLRALDSDPAFIQLRTITHEDPYTRRGFEKPRGYPGDAVLLDHIYGVAALPDPTTERGEKIYDWCQKYSTAFHSVKGRRDYFAAEIDKVSASAIPGPVLVVACGHFREGAASKSLINGIARNCIALDQDPRSLKLVQATFGALGVSTANLSVGGLLRNKLKIEPCSLIYAAGLFDYLNDDVAVALILRLEQMLAPGGKLVVPHFTQIHEAGYIEATMQWFLIYRNEEALMSLSDKAQGSRKTWRDQLGNISYLSIERAA